MATAQKISKVQDDMQDILPDLNTRYAYVLATPNEKRYGGVFDENGRSRTQQPYKPYLNILFSSSVVWPGGTDPYSGKNRPRGRYGLRYYDGCTTLFVDDQPRELDTLKALIAATREMNFSFGYAYVYGYDTLLKNYMDWCSYNEDSPYRVNSVEVKFKSVNTEKEILEEGDIMEMEDKARDLAKAATLKKMLVHARYLGIALEDPITQVALSEKSVRIGYRKVAKENPKDFIDSYNDKTVELRTWIDDAFSNGVITHLAVPNRVTWAKGGTQIMDVSGIKSLEIIKDKLVEFSQTDEGGDFASQLRDLYN